MGRLRLLTIILLSKTTSEIKKEIQEKNPQDFNDKNKETDSQFAKENNGEKISYQEYIEYYDKKYTKNEDIKKEENKNPKDIKIKKALDAYSTKEEEKPEIKIDGKI